MHHFIDRFAGILGQEEKRAGDKEQQKNCQETFQNQQEKSWPTCRKEKESNGSVIWKATDQLGDDGADERKFWSEKDELACQAQR